MESVFFISTNLWWCLFLQDPVEVLNSKNKQKQTDTQMTADSDEFNSFHFWREPPPSIDDSLLDLLVSSGTIQSEYSAGGHTQQLGHTILLTAGCRFKFFL